MLHWYKRSWRKRYVALIDSMITTFSISQIYRADKLLPAVADTTYRIKGYISFIKGYRHYKNKNTDSAEADFLEMLNQVTPDTIRDKNLITLKYAALSRLNIDRLADSSTFAQLFPLLEFVKEHPSRFSWWAEKPGRRKPGSAMMIWINLNLISGYPPHIIPIPAITPNVRYSCRSFPGLPPSRENTESLSVRRQCHSFRN